MKKFKLRHKATGVFLTKRERYYSFATGRQGGHTWGSKPSPRQQGVTLLVDGKSIPFDDFEIVEFQLVEVKSGTV